MKSYDSKLVILVTVSYFGVIVYKHIIMENRNYLNTDIYYTIIVLYMANAIKLDKVFVQASSEAYIPYFSKPWFHLTKVDKITLILYSFNIGILVNAV